MRPTGPIQTIPILADTAYREGLNIDDINSTSATLIGATLQEQSVTLSIKYTDVYLIYGEDGNAGPFAGNGGVPPSTAVGTTERYRFSQELNGPTADYNYGAGAGNQAPDDVFTVSLTVKSFNKTNLVAGGDSATAADDLRSMCMAISAQNITVNVEDDNTQAQSVSFTSGESIGEAASDSLVAGRNISDADSNHDGNYNHTMKSIVTGEITAISITNAQATAMVNHVIVAETVGNNDDDGEAITLSEIKDALKLEGRGGTGQDGVVVLDGLRTQDAAGVAGGTTVTMTWALSTYQGYGTDAAADSSSLVTAEVQGAAGAENMGRVTITHNTFVWQCGSQLDVITATIVNVTKQKK